VVRPILSLTTSPCVAAHRVRNPSLSRRKSGRWPRRGCPGGLGGSREALARVVIAIIGAAQGPLSSRRTGSREATSRRGCNRPPAVDEKQCHCPRFAERRSRARAFFPRLEPPAPMQRSFQARDRLYRRFTKHVITDQPDVPHLAHHAQAVRTETDRRPVEGQSTIAFLFTDVEGSTARWEADVAQARAAMGQQEARIRRAVEAHGGRVFKVVGDGLCAAFHVPVEACARPSKRSSSLPIRIGGLCPRCGSGWDSTRRTALRGESQPLPEAGRPPRGSVRGEPGVEARARAPARNRRLADESRKPGDACRGAGSR
jgi:class 3 adenylate cyclase